MRRPTCTPRINTREFLAFYPTNPRADYAQMQLGMVHFNQMLSPQRDQTETREAIRELQTFVDRFPNSKLLPVGEAAACARRRTDCRTRTARANFYSSIRLYSAPSRVTATCWKTDPEYTRRDSLYFHLAESLEKSGRQAEALPFYERLVQEFEKSEHLEETTRRIDRLKQELKVGATVER